MRKEEDWKNLRRARQTKATILCFGKPALSKDRLAAAQAEGE